MKIIDRFKSDKPSVSFEVFPPKRRDPALVGPEEARREMDGVKNIVREIAETGPSFMSVTYGAAGGSTGANTCEIARFLQESCGVTSLAHLTCISSDREKIADELHAFREAGIENILCLRGDYPPGITESEKSGPRHFRHAVDLIRALRPSTFCLGGACYPERHPECEHLADDIAHLKEKVDAGLDFLTTQMFFDNNVYFHYLARLRTAGVTVPVVAGIMPVTNGRQIARICALSGTTLPPRFRAIVDRFGDSPTAMMDAGIAYATEQVIDLLANGVNQVHVYTMNKPEIARRIMQNLHGIVG